MRLLAPGAGKPGVVPGAVEKPASAREGAASREIIRPKHRPQEVVRKKGGLEENFDGGRENQFKTRIIFINDFVI